MRKNQERRVVVTGLGVCAPGASNVTQFHELLLSGKSGIQFFSELKELGFGCQIGGRPEVSMQNLEEYFDKPWLKNLHSWGLVYGVLAGSEAWKGAGLPFKSDRRDAESGIIFGAGILGVDKLREAIARVDQGQVRRLGSTTVLQTMTSGISAYLAGLFGCGNRISTNSSACSTGTEAAILGYDWIRQGKAKRMLVGSTSEGGPYIWGGFDSMRVLPRRFNENPEQASRPLSATASGFVPSCGAGALVLEDLDSAQARGATIYAEICAGVVNSGGQREGGTFTAPNAIAVKECIIQTIEQSQLAPQCIEAINGHLTATKGDVSEVQAWKEVFSTYDLSLPPVNSFKGQIGHALAASGSIELVGCALQLSKGVLYGNVNLEDLHPDLLEVGADVFPTAVVEKDIDAMIKASFGFGDVNACLIFKSYPST